MKFSIGLASFLAAATGLVAAPASATITFSGFQTALNPGEVLVTGFEGGPNLSGVTFNEPGFSISGSGRLLTGSTSFSAAPATSATSRDTSQYLSVGRGQSAVLATPLLSAISFYIGSLDAFNSFTFHLANGSTQVLTGSLLDAVPGLDANGDQAGFASNGRLIFSFDSPIDQVILSSANDSLEVSDIGAEFAVPEPGSWAMMIMGFGGVGAILRQSRSKGRRAREVLP